MTCDIIIEAGYNDKGDYCLTASTDKYDLSMPISLDNLDEVVSMLNNAIVDIQCEERVMLARENQNSNYNDFL